MTEMDTTDRSIHFEFHCRKSKQKHLVQILLIYSDLDLKQLASTLDIPVDCLLKVSRGQEFLKDQYAVNLVELFLMLMVG